MVCGWWIACWPPEYIASMIDKQDADLQQCNESIKHINEELASMSSIREYVQHVTYLSDIIEKLIENTPIIASTTDDIIQLSKLIVEIEQLRQLLKSHTNTNQIASSTNPVE